MIGNQAFIARKYAQAFLNLYQDHVSVQDFNNICLMAKFFSEHKKLLYFLTWPTIPNTVKASALYKVLEVYHVSNRYFKKLIDTLIEHKRAFLILHVSQQLCSEYKKRHKIMFVHITSSHPLQENELSSIKDLMQGMIKETIMYSHSIDSALIAGIRMQSETFLWEHSVRNKLNRIKLQLVHL